MNRIGFGQHTRPTLVISDVHGSVHWKGFVEQRRPGERVVFLGDYFDRRGVGPFVENDVQNFLEICAYARSHTDTWLLMGNHDFAYTPYARWQPEPWGWAEQATRDAIMANLDLLGIVHLEDDGVIFSHGGVTRGFLELNYLAHPEEINELWRESPRLFEWLERNPANGDLSAMNGDDPWQSPIWARTMALTEDGVPGYHQVVGHTPVRIPEVMTTQSGDKLLLTCTLDDTLIRIGAEQ